MRRGEIKDRRELYVCVSHADREFHSTCFYFSRIQNILHFFCGMNLTHEFLLHKSLVSELFSILHCY